MADKWDLGTDEGEARAEIVGGALTLRGAGLGFRHLPHEDEGIVASLVQWSGERATLCTVEFLTVSVRNVHTRRAYLRAVQRFAAWCAARSLPIHAVQPPHVAHYIEVLGRAVAAVSVKQHLAALKHWFDSLVLGHVLEANPAHAVRGPRYAQDAGKTPVLEREDVKKLLDSMAGEDMASLRDRALIATMLFSFARVGALVAMKVRR